MGWNPPFPVESCSYRGLNRSDSNLRPQSVRGQFVLLIPVSPFSFTTMTMLNMSSLYYWWIFLSRVGGEKKQGRDLIQIQVFAYHISKLTGGKGCIITWNTRHQKFLSTSLGISISKCKILCRYMYIYIKKAGYSHISQQKTNLICKQLAWKKTFKISKQFMLPSASFINGFKSLTMLVEF